MALKTYERQARLTDGISLDVAPMRETLRGYDRIGSALDSMAQFVYKDMATRAEMKGKEYGVTQRPTVQQISDAVRKGEDVSTYFAEGGTIFGDAAREAQAEMFRQDLEFDVVNQLNAVKTGMRTGFPVEDPEMFAQEIQSMIDGYGETLVKISPLQTLKFKAGMTIEGNKLYKEVLDIYNEKVTAEHQITITNAIDQYGTDLYDLLMETDGDFIDSEGYMLKRYQMIEDYLDRVPNKKLDNQTALQEMVSLTYKKAIIDYVIGKNAEFVPADSNLIAEIRKGNVGKLSPIYKDFTIKQREEFEDELIKSLNRYRDIQKGQQDQLNAQHRKDKLDIDLQVARGNMSGMEAIQQLTKKGIDLSKEEMKAYLAPNVDTQDNVFQATKLEDKIRRGDAGIADIEAAHKSGTINTTQYATLMSKYTTNVQNLNTGIRLLKNGLGLDEFTDYNLIPPLKQERLDNLSKKLSDRAYEAFLKGEAFNQYAVVTDLLNENKKSEKETNLEKSLSTLQSYLPEGTIVNENNYDLFDTMKELKALGLNKDTRDKILTEVKNLKDILGVQ